MADTITITLGGQRFRVGALNFRQLRDIEEALGRAAKPGAPAGVDFDVAIDVLATALGRTHPGMDRDAILDLEGTKAELVTATRAVLGLSGYIERETPPGEARAGD
ncbi:MAG: hypothetical protein ACREE3_09750 [Stellaceae bacterium]